MATVKQLQANARRRTTRLWTILATMAVVLVMMVVLVVMTASAYHSQQSKGTGALPGPGPSAGASTSAPPVATAAPARWVTLPPNTGWADASLPTLWPQTPQGACAMVAATAQYGWTLDQGQDVQAAELYTTSAAQQASIAGADQIPAQLMTAVGISATAPPTGLSITATPIGVAWSVTDATDVRVSLLVRLNAEADGADSTAEVLEAITTDVVWTPMSGQPDGGDWRMALSVGKLPTPPAADVGTVAFNTAGWTAIANTGGNG